MKITIGMAFVLVSLAYSIGLSVLYFAKQHVKNYETKLFGVFLPANVFGLCLEMSCTLSIMLTGTTSLISIILTKLFLIYLIFFVLLLLLYVYIVCGSKNTVIALNEKQKRGRNIFIGLFVIASIVDLIMPIEIVSVDSAMYSVGMATTFVYAISAVASLYCIVKFLLNIKNLKNKKNIPMIVYILGTGIMALFQQRFPEITVATSMETFVIFLMYNTIENPDLKMVQALEVAREQADKANRAKTDFLSSMSHEIRTPLNAIVGFSSEIMEAKDLDEAQTNAKDIVNASDTLLEIVNGILDISKIEAGKVEVISAPYNAPEAFRELARLITPKMDEKGLDFSYEITGELPSTLIGDLANLKKVVTNLLSNACKYTDRGYVHFEVNCSTNNNGVCRLVISIEDSGHGIKEDSINAMFSKFQRIDEVRNTNIEGTGLGLNITKQLVELMGGKILVRSTYGEGSKFTVVLNQKVGTVPVEETKLILSNLDLTNVRIMIVDDTPLNLKVASKLLERYNARNIVTCSSGFECLERIERGEQYDIILLDDMMPKMSGVETFHKLKENPDFKTPAIALTANAISGMREKYLAEGFDGYLSKPINKEQLVQVFNQILLGGNNKEEEEKEKAKAKKQAEETENKAVIIPVESNIEAILGDSLNRNYRKGVEKMNELNTDKTVIEINSGDASTTTTQAPAAEAPVAAPAAANTEVPAAPVATEAPVAEAATTIEINAAPAEPVAPATPEVPAAPEVPVAQETPAAPVAAEEPVLQDTPAVETAPAVAEPAAPAEPVEPTVGEVPEIPAELAFNNEPTDRAVIDPNAPAVQAAVPEGQTTIEINAPAEAPVEAAPAPQPEMPDKAVEDPAAPAVEAPVEAAPVAETPAVAEQPSTTTIELTAQTDEPAAPAAEAEVLDAPTAPAAPVEAAPVAEAQPAPVAEAPAADANATYDQKYLEDHGVDMNNALELLGDMEMYNDTIKDFVSEVETKWADITKFKNESNMPEYAILVHSLKSDCKYLGFMTLADIAYQHELKSKENDAAYVNENFQALETEYQKILALAKDYVNHNS